MDTYPDVMRLAESGNAEGFIADLRARADRSLYFFTKVVLGYRDLVDHYHLPFCEAVQSREYLKRGFLRPRGTFKSTVISKAYPLWRLAKDPTERILIASASAKVAKKPLRDIKWHLLNNGLFRALYPELLPPDINQTTWTETEILLPRPQSFDECSITTTGVESAVTGFHYTLIIPDDIIGEDEGTAPGEADMLRAIEWLKAMPGLKVHPQFSEEVYGGTRWKDGERDCYGWLMAHDPSIKWNVEGATDEDGNAKFPERLSLEVLESIRKRMGDYLYFCNYMNDPIAPEGVDFPATALKTYKVGEDRKTIIPTDGTPPVHLESLIRMSMYDVSAGGRSAKAENAVVFAGMDSMKRVFVLAAWMKNTLIGAACEEWLKLGEKFRTYKDHYECIGAQKAVEDVIKLRNAEPNCAVCNRKHRRLTPIPVKPPGGGTVNKDDRIRMYAGPTIEGGRLYLMQGMDALRKQIITFPHGELKDGFDALAYLCHLLYAPPSSEYIAEEKDREQAQKQLAHKARTNTEHAYGGYV